MTPHLLAKESPSYGRILLLTQMASSVGGRLFLYWKANRHTQPRVACPPPPNFIKLQW